MVDGQKPCKTGLVASVSICDKSHMQTQDSMHNAAIL